MFDNLTARLATTFKALAGLSRFTEENIQQPLREIRLSLIEADVALPVVKDFIKRIQEQVLGEKVASALKPDQHLLKIVRDELVHLLGDERAELNFKTQPPAVFLLVGLQGGGKTTSAAKLAYLLKDIEKKKVMLVSTDVYRPAAIEQLALLASPSIPFFPAREDENPLHIAQKALEQAKKQFMDVLIVDTAGRLHVDAGLMEELKNMHRALNPIETLLVVDSMAGQDTANTAKVFHDSLSLTGVILTKADGDSRGGAALSIKQITGLPIKFLGVGEKTDALEPFHPDRIASRILGMGDILTLIEEVERKADKKASKQLADKIKTGQGFDFEDYKQQLTQMSKMGGLTSMVSKLPGLSQLSKQASHHINDKAVAKKVAIINSMTVKERRFPKLISGSRKKRIALGSGTPIPEVNRLLKEYEQLQKMMSKLSRPGALNQLMRGMGNTGGMGDLQNMLAGQFKNINRNDKE